MSWGEMSCSERTAVNDGRQPFWALVCLLLLLTVSQPSWARSVALLIGNADYSFERRLRNPVNDAELLGGVLRTHLKFDDVRVERDLGVAAMDRAIGTFIERARGADTVVFYYSGHGMKKSANDRRNFLLPVDARTGTADALDLERQAVSAESVRDRLKGLGARITLLVLDACRDGPGGGTRSGNKGLSRNGGGNQLLVAYATEEDQVAEDGTGRNSPYAVALAQALQKPEPLLAQLDWVADEVQRQVPGQMPTRDGNLRHNAYLISSPSPPMTVENRASIEDEAWGLCRAASTGVPCDDYLSGWPQGRYRALARTRLRELQGAGRPSAQLPAQTSSAGVSPPATVAPANVTVPAMPKIEKVTFTADAFFGARSAMLPIEDALKLEEIVSRISDVRLEVIVAVGHASPDEGSDAQVLQLSLKRAEAVRANLVNLGIERNRIYVDGHGARQPAADNVTAEGRAKNRRVEVEVVVTRAGS